MSSNNTTNSANLQSRKRRSRRSDSTETVKSFRPSHHRRYSAEGLWKAADDVFTTDVTRSSSPVSTTPPSTPPGVGSRGGRSHRRKSSATSAAGTGRGRRLSANYAAEEDRQSRGKVERWRHSVVSVTPVNVQATLAVQHNASSSGDNIGEEESKENNNHDSSTHAPNPKGKEREDPPPASSTPRPPLRVINTNPKTEIDEFCDAEESEETPVPPSQRPPLPVQSSRAQECLHIENAKAQAISSSRVAGYPNTCSGSVFNGNSFAYPAQGIPAGWGNAVSLAASQNGAHCLMRAGSDVARVSVRVKPREDHITFWDARDEETLFFKGRLELHDLLHETYYHHASILVRSYVAPDIRGIEHPEEPEFVMLYREPLRKRGDDTTDNGGMNAAIIKAAIEAGGTDGVPDWARTILDDVFKYGKDKTTEITTSEWAELVDEQNPLWAKYFSIPIPVRLFETRETRLFQIQAKVSFLSRIESGRYHELQAPMVQVSISHLLSARELGIRH